MLESYLKLLGQGYYEVTFAFKGLSDENVWKRPAPGLLSVGELAGHLAYWEAVRLTSTAEGGEQADPIEEHQFLSKCKISSPLLDERFSYYPTTIDNPPSEALLAMTAEQVCQELLRVHEESVAYFKALNPALDSTPPGWSHHWTYGSSLEYLVFHIAYHTGQMYSARHLLGDQTPDN